MSFDESVFPAGFNQKIAKEDLFVKGNRVTPHDKQCGKTLEDSKGYSTEVGHVTLPCGAGRPTVRPAGLWGHPVSLPFECRFSTAS